MPHSNPGPRTTEGRMSPTPTAEDETAYQALFGKPGGAARSRSGDNEACPVDIRSLKTCGY